MLGLRRVASILVWFGLVRSWAQAQLMSPTDQQSVLETAHQPHMWPVSPLVDSHVSVHIWWMAHALLSPHFIWPGVVHIVGDKFIRMAWCTGVCLLVAIRLYFSRSCYILVAHVAFLHVWVLFCPRWLAGHWCHRCMVCTRHVVSGTGYTARKHHMCCTFEVFLHSFHTTLKIQPP